MIRIIVWLWCVLILGRKPLYTLPVSRCYAACHRPAIPGCAGHFCIECCERSCHCGAYLAARAHLRELEKEGSI